MSIAPMAKVTLVGISGEKGRVLEKLQELGCLQVLPLGKEGQLISTPYPKEAYEALRYLLDSPMKRQLVSEWSGYDLKRVVAEALALRDRQRDIQDRIDELQERIAEVRPWGEFRFPPVQDLEGHRLWFYVVPLYAFQPWDGSGLTWQLVQRDHRDAYVVVISPELPPADRVPGRRSRVGRRPLSELEIELERSVAEMEDTRAERWALTRFAGLMIRHLNEAEDAEALRRAARQALDAGELFAVQGWVPERELPRLESCARDAKCAMMVEPPLPDESPPVLLDNPRSLQPGEDLVAFYQLPGYRDWDPSGVVFLFFALFFAMILGDAGYAALILIGTALFWKRIQERTRWLLLILGVLSFAYGVVLGSYFGAAPAETSFFSRLKLLEVNDYRSMMRLSVGIGVFHLVLANLVAAWNQRRRSTALARLGWAVAIGGGFAGFLGRMDLAAGALVAGGVAVLLFSSERPLRRPADLAMRLFDGFLGLTGASKAFGDVLSYLRLFALGLASTSLAVTFNQLASDVMGGGLGIGLLLGLLILVLGHGINFVLGVVGGTVHGLRLNLIEMYGWSIFGEGNQFQALRRRETLPWKT